MNLFRRAPRTSPDDPATRPRLRRRVALIGVLAAALAIPAFVVASSPANAAPTTPKLTTVRAASHTGFDRVVWEFSGPVPKTRIASYVPALYSDGEGRRLPVSGAGIIQLTMYSANAHDPDTYKQTVPTRVSYGLNNVTETVLAGDFEAVVTYGVGVVNKQPFKVYTLANPSRVVLDIRTDYTKTAGKVTFLNQPNYIKGVMPYTQAKARPLRAAAPASAALYHLFAGPTPAERAAGMRFVSSEATGWKNLSISNGIARVQLTGGCRNNGSTMTVANMITPTLKQFPSVKYVKIYDPQGKTGRPTGNSDSLPTCLEP